MKAMNTIQQTIQQNGNTEMLTDEQAFSWKKALNSIQEGGRKEKLTDEQASSWMKAMNLTQQNGNTGMLMDEQTYQCTQFNRMEERKCSRTKKLLAEWKQWT